MQDTTSRELTEVFDPSGCDARQQLIVAHYLEKLRKKDNSALGFFPFEGYRERISSGHCLLVCNNDEPAGFLLWGRDNWVIRIYQVCIQHDARRAANATALLKALPRHPKTRGAITANLRCRDDLPSNAFWTAVGCIKIGQVPGGRKRGTPINQYAWPLELADRL